MTNSMAVLPRYSREVRGVVKHLNRLVVADYQLPRRDLGDRTIFDGIPSIVARIGRSSLPLVYTAFDGDHFGLAAKMRSYVLRQGNVPVNPESVLGYKQLVDARRDKSGVMLDDLALVRVCDQLIVFTDAAPTPIGVADRLAEGAILELLLFLCRFTDGKSTSVTFVPLGCLFGSGATERRFEYSYEETVGALGPDQKGIVSFIESIRSGRRSLPTITGFAIDPLDTKYGHWLRSFSYGRGRAPLVPQLAVELGDGESAGRSQMVGAVVLSWVRLLDLADELRLLPPAEFRSRESYVVELLSQYWQVGRPERRPVEKLGWFDVGIPKVVAGQGWPLTEREAMFQ